MADAEAGALFSLVSPEAYIGAFVQNGIRRDARALSELRPLVLSSNPFVPSAVVGSSMVQLGATRMCCAVQLQIGAPANLPNEGEVIFEVTLGPLCSHKYDQRGKPDDAYELESLLASAFTRNKRVLDLSQLCIVQDKHVFKLIVQIVCLSHAGNIQDAAVLAATYALRSVKLPDIEFAQGIGGGGDAIPRPVSDPTNSKGRPLKLLASPVSVTLCLFQRSLLVDPDQEEAQVAHGVFRCVLLEDGHICHLAHHSAKGGGFSKEDLAQAVALCSGAASQIRASLETPLP